MINLTASTPFYYVIIGVALAIIITSYIDRKVYCNNRGQIVITPNQNGSEDSAATVQFMLPMNFEDLERSHYVLMKVNIKKESHK